MIMTAKIEACEGWMYPAGGEEKIPVGFFKSPITLNLFNEPKTLYFSAGEDIAVGVTAEDQLTVVEVCTYLDDGTPEPEPTDLGGLVEKSVKGTFMEKGGTPMGVVSTYYLKEPGAFVQFGYTSRFKVMHEESPKQKLPEMGKVISM